MHAHYYSLYSVLGSPADQEVLVDLALQRLLGVPVDKADVT